MKTFFKPLLFLAAFVTLAAPLRADQPTTPHTKVLIIGGSRGLPFSLAEEIQKRAQNGENISCTLFVRNKKKTAKLFSGSNMPTIVEGDVTAANTTHLAQAAAHASYMIVGQTFPYKVWKESIGRMIDNCLTVSREVGCQLVYPTRIFQYGEQYKITETTEPKPNSEQGKVLHDIEQQIENAGKTNLVKTRIICHAYPFGPNVGDGLLDTNFRGMLKKSWFGSVHKFEWIGSGNIVTQLAYTPDLARFILDYLVHSEVADKPFHRINFEGVALPSINSLGQLYADKAGIGDDYGLSLYTRTGLSLAALARPEARRAKDVFYAFEKELIIDGSLRRSLFKEWKMTSLEEAVGTTHQWYKSHQ